jgi:TolA-binding protein
MNALLRTLALIAAVGTAPLVAQDPQVRLATNAAVANPARDTAILRLESFLARYPDSPLRPEALLELGELLVREANDRFDAAQRAAAPATGDTTATAAADSPIRPDYAEAIQRYEELVRRYPDFEKTPVAAYTLGTMYMQTQRYADASRTFALVTARDSAAVAPSLRAESFFRLGDAQFELASRAAGTERRTLFGRAAEAYEQATATAAPDGDIYFLALYKLGWSYYNQATRTNEEAYRRAVEVFGRLVDAYDRLSPEQQARLGLRGEAIEYMAVAFTQVGGAEAANRYFAAHGGSAVKLPVLRRVAGSLRDQGNFPAAIDAYRALINEAPTDSAALASQREIVDIYRNRMIEPTEAQAARMELVERFAPGTPWASANPGLADEAAAAREEALRQSAQYVLAEAQAGRGRARFGEAAALYERYLREFSSADSVQMVNLLYAEALFGQGEFMRAGAEYTRAAFDRRPPPARPATDSVADSVAARRTASTATADTINIAQRAALNAIVAYDSALTRAQSDRAAQDSLFGAVDRFVRAYPQAPEARQALIQKGRRASDTQRWDAMADAFRMYAATYPDDPYTPTAQKLVGDALFRGGQYAQAQAQWDTAVTIAQRSGRRALVDSILRTRETAAATFADTLIRQGEYRRAAEDVYVAFAEANPGSSKAPEALRDAIATYVLADSVARARGDEGEARHAKERAIELANRLAERYPNYEHTRTFQQLAARYLGELGRREESVEVLRRLVNSNPSWPGRADAMVRIAVELDSLGRDTEAAAAYAAFAAAFPRDSRAADAQFNAAVTYLEAGDTVSAARAYGQYADRYPRGEHAAIARTARAELLHAAGDTSAARIEFARLCQRPTEANREECAAYRAESAFRTALDAYRQYNDIELVITSRNQLASPAALNQAQSRKRSALQRVVAQLRGVINTGVPEYVAAGTFYIGLAQWEYGDYLRNMEIRVSGLTDEERDAARRGAEQAAEKERNGAREIWRALLEKAREEDVLRDDEKARRWLDLTRDAIDGRVPSTPPPPGGEENQ